MNRGYLFALGGIRCFVEGSMSDEHEEPGKNEASRSAFRGILVAVVIAIASVAIGGWMTLRFAVVFQAFQFFK